MLANKDNSCRSLYVHLADYAYPSHCEIYVYCKINLQSRASEIFTSSNGGQRVEGVSSKLGPLQPPLVIRAF